MVSFKLVFNHRVEDPDGMYGFLDENNLGDYLKTAETVRTIVTSDIEMAKKIGKAMEGEQIYAYEYIGKLKTIESVREKPEILAFTSLDQIWDRVLKNMNLNENDVEFYYQDNEKLGLVLK